MTNGFSMPIKAEAAIEDVVRIYLVEAAKLVPRLVSGPGGTQIRFPAENLQFNSFGQEPYLLVSKFDLASLPIRVLQRLPIYLLRQFEIQVELDSRWYWALTNDVVTHSTFLRQWPLSDTWRTLMAARFATLGQAPTSPAIMQLNRVISEVVPGPTQDLVLEAGTVVLHLAYPVLEGLTKHLLSRYVNLDGEVITQFVSGQTSYPLGHKISSLGKLLRVLSTSADPLLGKPNLAADLSELEVEIRREGIRGGATFGADPADGWNWVYQMRNDVLHGAARAPMRAGLLTHIACLLLWHSVDPQEAQQALTHAAQLAQSGRRMFMPMRFGNYYPPLA